MKRSIQRGRRAMLKVMAQRDQRALRGWVAKYGAMVVVARCS